ncbi:MAG: iron ABC transporter permease [Corynebacterium sp.]|nr:iron ABC transporter permease [Corynebacterium sp.]
MDYSQRRLWGLVGILIGLVLLTFASIFIGSNSISAARVLEVLGNRDDSYESTVIFEQRIPRTLLVIVVGSALGVAGALMQALTRNPLADPGILGVNAGASLAVVIAVAAVGNTSIWFYMWFAFLGACLASIAVYVLGSLGGATQGGGSPARLALAGVAISMAVSSIVQVVILSNQNAYNEFRFWAAGSTEGRGYAVFFAVLGFIIAGIVIAIATAPGLNAIALGDDTGAALGVKVQRLRIWVMIAVTLLAGAATAAVGPIMFIGLGVPYIARGICGPNQRWVIPFSAAAAPLVMLVADLLARVVIAPQEIQTGIVTAILGGPLFIYVIRRRKVEAV